MRSASSSARAGRRSKSVGIYVPGGTAAYPSSVLMNAVPAKVAGVERIVMVVPDAGRANQPAGARRGEACRRRRDLPDRRRAGGRRARLRHRDDRARWSRSSARATPSSPPPSGRFSAQVGIDMIAGPSEVLVVADARQRSRLDRRRPPRPGRARRRRAGDPHHRRQRCWRASVEAASSGSSRRFRAARSPRASWRDFGAIIRVDDLSQAPALDRPHRAGASRARRRRPRGARSQESAMPARSSSGAIRRR